MCGRDTRTRSVWSVRKNSRWSLYVPVHPPYVRGGRNYTHNRTDLGLYVYVYVYVRTRTYLLFFLTKKRNLQLWVGIPLRFVGIRFYSTSTSTCLVRVLFVLVELPHLKTTQNSCIDSHRSAQSIRTLRYELSTHRLILIE